MCGIAGYVGGGSEQDLRRMVESIRHRGPDAQGFFCENGVALGHARLSIIDLTPSGAQPMWNNDHTVSVIFNGEIYNYKELKKELPDHIFQSSSDTEVIIALYEKYGERCFEKMNGMFAIALYDRQKHKLLLARDRMGKKPLYYQSSSGTFVFASELKAILAHPVATKEIDLSALNTYLALDYIPTPLSVYKKVKKLEPGTFLVYEQKKIRIESYWNPDTHESKISFKDAVRELDKKIGDAVRSRLVSDVPLGIFLSGGLDSSTVAYYGAKASDKPIHTFSIGFEEASFDESDYASTVSRHLKTEHHHKILSGRDSLDIIPSIFSMLDEPMADASIIPTYLLSRFTKDSVTVALGGDGGDELFAGYPTFQAERFVQTYQMLPTLIKKQLIERAVEMLPMSDNNLSLKFKSQKFLEGSNEQNIADRHMRWLGTFSKVERKNLFTPEVWNELSQQNVYDKAEDYLASSSAEDVQNQLLWVYQRTYMMDQVMVKVDRASMFASLETRAPFLDYKLVEFANQLPYDYKLHGLTTKYILKELMRQKLPDNIIDRPKKGFGVPIGAWLRGPMQEWAEELLSENSIAASGLFEPKYIRTLWSEHLAGSHDHRKKLWNILVFLEWQKNFV